MKKLGILVILMLVWVLLPAITLVDYLCNFIQRRRQLPYLVQCGQGCVLIGGVLVMNFAKKSS